MELMITYKDSVEGFCLVTAVPKEKIEDMLGPMTDAEYRAHVYERSVPSGATEIQEVTRQDLPVNLKYFAAWKKGSVDKIEVDLEKAKEIHMDYIRVERDKELQKLDIQTLKGIDVQAEKQALRDLPQTFDLSGAQNLEQLEAMWPAILPARE